MMQINSEAGNNYWLTGLIAVVVFQFISLGCAMAKSTAVPESSQTRLVILYDNQGQNQNMTSDWGFSCLVQKGAENLLFDTGANSTILMENMKKAGILDTDIQHLFLSHIHKDHVGGLKGVIQRYPGINIYAPASFPPKLKQGIKNTGAKLTEIRASQKIGNSFWTTGEMWVTLIEQSLVIRTSKGLVIVTGCAHPGIIEIIEKVRKKNTGNIHLVIGGFHLRELRDFEIQHIIKSFRALAVQKVAPCHCSGTRTRQLFKKEYGDNYIECGVGAVIEIE